ncbi:nucleotidyltransferase domain-containing protein [Merismopedia glauca CCAP 1448/3]|uniref:Nucleotidyltransferase domain-containing protein n=2 Tax=Merismopedia TaxID=53402 RepID=A0A2T1BX91_9CYAN|nr:nucleotidyltransferase domain-containing protein [Merismopedia glauca CCAP 1448/3]
MPPVTEEIIAEITQSLVTELNPEEIVLFGSYAWGQPNEYSDIDLCVIVPDGIAGFNRVEWGIRGLNAVFDIYANVDIVVMPRSLMDSFKKVPASLHRKIADQGILLYGSGKTYSGHLLAQKST